MGRHPAPYAWWIVVLSLSWSTGLLYARTASSFDLSQMTQSKHPIAQMIGRSHFPGRGRPTKNPPRIVLPHNASRNDPRPGQFEPRARLVDAIARGRRWLDDVVSGRVATVAELCAREKCTVRQVNMTISLAFLAPNLVKAAVEGRLPRGIGIEGLRHPPTEWSRQFESLGLNPE